MNKKKRVKVRIAGEDFFIFTDESAEHVSEIANYINRKIEEINEKSSHLSKTIALAMTCLILADDLVKMGDRKYEDVKNRINDKMADVLEKKINALQEELENNNELLKISEQRILSLQKLLTKKNEEIDSLKKNNKNK